MATTNNYELGILTNYDDQEYVLDAMSQGASGYLMKSVEPETLIAWLGPGIGQSAYEVGEEVRDVFLKSDSGAAACFQLNRFGRWQADLYGLARRSLRIAGLDAIYGGNFCTYTDSDRFFSHRRSSPCGRMATVIWLDSI